MPTATFSPATIRSPTWPAIGWVKPYKNQGQDLDDFPHLKRWFETMLARPAVERALEVGQDHRNNLANDKEAQKVLFGQRARA